MSAKTKETDEKSASDFPVRARKDALRLAGLVQEAIACGMEAEKMPGVASKIRDVLNSLERTVDLLKKHRPPKAVAEPAVQ